MKKLFFAALFASLATLGVRADTVIVDNNPANVWINAANQSYTGHFRLTDYGYVPGSMHVVSADVSFTFFDLFGGSETFTINLDGVTFGNYGPIGNTFSTAVVDVEGFSATVFAHLNDTGELAYTVSRTGRFSLFGNEFWLDNARMTATVPDGATTALLLGLGLVGISLLSRTRFRLQPVRK